MNQSGDAAEQMLRITLDGVDHLLRLTGAGAKNLAGFIMAALKKNDSDDKLKLSGEERLTKMLKSGKELKIFPMKNGDLELFSKEAKKYGVVYCALKDKDDTNPDSTVDVMVKADDESKVSRIMERLQFATVDRASVEVEMEKQNLESKTHDAPDKDDTDKLIDMLIDKDGKAIKDEPEKAATEKTNPTPASTEKSNQSVSRSKTQEYSAERTAKTKKPESVRKFLRERTAQNNKNREEAKTGRNQPETRQHKQTRQKTRQHKQPITRTRKNKIIKER